MLHFYLALWQTIESNVDFSMTQIKKTCHGTNFLFKQLSLEHPNKAPFIRDSTTSSPQTSVFLDSPEIDIMNSTSSDENNDTVANEMYKRAVVIVLMTGAYKTDIDLIHNIMLGQKLTGKSFYKSQKNITQKLLNSAVEITERVQGDFKESKSNLISIDTMYFEDFYIRVG
jgi:hypothetical protein